MRIQSPSSINTYKQCPRKYYYLYIEKIPGKTSIHLIRGSIAHKVLENFFKINPKNINPENYEIELNVLINSLLNTEWANHIEEIQELEDNHEWFFEETKTMISRWIDTFISELKPLLEDNSFEEAFNILKPKTEEQYSSEKHKVRGYIDAINENGKETIITDYKTSSKDIMKDEYKLQLAIYAMLYKEKHGKIPDKVSIDFLKFGKQFIKCEEELIDFAKRECQKIHEKTKSNNIEDYPKKTSPLCKWRTGQCDYYHLCFKD